MILCRFCIDPFWDKSSFVAWIEDAKPVLILNRFCKLPYPNRLCACFKTGFVPTVNQLLQNRLCACSKTGFVPTLNQPLQNRLCACSKTGFVPTLNQPLQNRLCACSKTKFVPSLNLLHQNRLCAYAQPAAPNRLCIGTKPAFSFWIKMSTVSEVRCDCQGLGLVARIEATNLVFDTKQVLYWSVLGQIQFCSFDRRYKTCLDIKPVLYQGRFCSLTDGWVNSREADDLRRYRAHYDVTVMLGRLFASKKLDRISFALLQVICGSFMPYLTACKCITHFKKYQRTTTKAVVS